MNAFCKSMIFSLLLVAALSTPGISAAPGAAQSSASSNRYAGYEVDGRTSASVIAAKRLHTVSERDETGLAIYSGVFVIALILFFANQLQKPK
jgi:hypothetical protein